MGRKILKKIAENQCNNLLARTDINILDSLYDHLDQIVPKEGKAKTKLYYINETFKNYGYKPGADYILSFLKPIIKLNLDCA